MTSARHDAWVAITGAGTGIGRELALQFGRRGFRLELAGRRPEALERVLDDAGNAGGVERLDVTQESKVRAWAEARVGAWGPPAVVVPAAGAGWVAPAAETSADELSALLATNLTGAATTIQAFLPSLRAAGAGLVVGLLSVAARRSFPGWSAYCATKAGLAAYLQALRLELAGTGVRILEVYPGATDTPIWDDLPGQWNRSAMMRADEVAAAIVANALAGPSLSVEELHLGPVGGALSG